MIPLVVTPTAGKSDVPTPCTLHPAPYIPYLVVTPTSEKVEPSTHTHLPLPAWGLRV